MDLVLGVYDPRVFENNMKRVSNTGGKSSFHLRYV